MKDVRTTPVVNYIARIIGYSRRAILMVLVLTICTIASAQAHEFEYASISRPTAILGVPVPSSLSTPSEELLPVNIRKEIGLFFEEPNEGILKLPFNLSGTSDVTVTVTTPEGATAYHIERQDVAAGRLELIINLRAAGLSDGEYTVQIGLSRAESSAHYAQTVALR